MINLPQVTICAIDCIRQELSLKAINTSMQGITFGRAVIMSHTQVVDPNIEWIQIPFIGSIQEYSDFVFKKLNDYITTEFVLTVQSDGFIINPGLWDNKWLQYDYIGAPWWYDDGRNVGNGGFSLRSKKLLELLTRDELIDTHPEDDKICRRYRPYLESLGVKFAPDEEAMKFSFEGNMKRTEFKNDTFGFHGIKVKGVTV